MKILMITPVLYDEKSPFNHLLKDLIEKFISHNMIVQRIIAVNKSERNKDGAYLGIKDERVKYIKIKRHMPKKDNFIMRFIFDSWTTVKMALMTFTVKNIDIIFEDMSYSSIILAAAGKIRKIPIVLMVQDVWPDNAVQCGVLKNRGFTYKIFDLIQKHTYGMADSIITISEDIKAFLQEKGVRSEKITVIYNWGYTDEIYEIEWNNNAFVKKFNLSTDVFYVIYAGNIGKMQNVDIILFAAQQLKFYEKIRFLIVGDGVSREEKIRMADEFKLTNIEFLQMQPEELAPHIYSSAGVNIIPLVNGGVKTALPSKTGICLSCGKPVILCVEKNSHYAELIKNYSAGIVVEPDDYNELADMILRMSKNEFNQKYNGYRCFKDNFRKTENLNKYLDIINRILNRK